MTQRKKKAVCTWHWACCLAWISKPIELISKRYIIIYFISQISQAVVYTVLIPFDHRTHHIHLYFQHLAFVLEFAARAWQYNFMAIFMPQQSSTSIIPSETCLFIKHALTYYSLTPPSAINTSTRERIEICDAHNHTLWSSCIYGSLIGLKVFQKNRKMIFIFHMAASCSFTTTRTTSSIFICYPHVLLFLCLFTGKPLYLLNSSQPNT